MRKILIITSALLVAPLTVMAQGTVAPPSDTFVFRFQPPEGITVRQTYKLERTRKIEGQASIQDESESQTEGQFRRVGDGFEYSPKTTASAARRNGAAITDPVLGLLSRIQMTYVISKGGEAIDVRGFADVEQLLKSSQPARIAAALAPILNEASLVEQQKIEWNARYADFADGSFRIGDVIDVQAPQKLPNGETILYTIRTSFPGWEPCPAGRCIRLKQIYESDAAELGKLVEGVVGRLSEAKATPVQDDRGSRITGSLSRLIDPKTMLIYSEEMKRSISMRIQVPGQGLWPVVQEETRTYTYAYE
ncbi:hypothetical protein [Uliginosibacterium sediminicola]|uniref:Uncharacterized protein n=1 Tax=Uliginosibacterium sediminicola TaxID=2024550 RepID=A0ABU9YYN2_9RHOO